VAGLNGMHRLREATLVDLETAASWVHNQHETDRWAGGKVIYPIDRQQMIDAVQWHEASNQAIGASDLLAFGQILEKEAGRLHLARLIVHPERRREGLGLLLVSGLLHVARTQGAHVISLNVDPANMVAVRLYERLGFRAIPGSPNALAARFLYMEAAGVQERSGVS
jgi:ribosomal protein S18 acetylase RimI-like enzyme